MMATFPERCTQRLTPAALVLVTFTFGGPLGFQSSKSSSSSKSAIGSDLKIGGWVSGFGAGAPLGSSYSFDLQQLVLSHARSLGRTDLASAGFVSDIPALCREVMGAPRWG
ncbi:hypothetical protein C8Q72DRAFT_805070 [Fomitopsis betulina]|nr:hypothetical protein C8Q72DRAFT_805070 [Fomitopsis betulina]